LVVVVVFVDVGGSIGGGIGIGFVDCFLSRQLISSCNNNNNSSTMTRCSRERKSEKKVCHKK
jgi:hypothetical protein